MNESQKLLESFKYIAVGRPSASSRPNWTAQQQCRSNLLDILLLRTGSTSRCWWIRCNCRCSTAVITARTTYAVRQLGPKSLFLLFLGLSIWVETIAPNVDIIRIGLVYTLTGFLVYVTWLAFQPHRSWMFVLSSVLMGCRMGLDDPHAWPVNTINRSNILNQHSSFTNTGTSCRLGPTIVSVLSLYVGLNEKWIKQISSESEREKGV
jgi:hypothetical protein